MLQYLEFDKSTEISEKQYNLVKTKCSGLVAHREENGKFFIKLWFPKYKKYVLSVLNSI